MILQILNGFFLTSTKVQSLKFDMYFEFVKQTVLKAEPISLRPHLVENVFYFIKPILKKKKPIYNQIIKTLHLWVSKCLGT